jgi:hypothetical protein
MMSLLIAIDSNSAFIYFKLGHSQLFNNVVFCAGEQDNWKQKDN